MPDLGGERTHAVIPLVRIPIFDSRREVQGYELITDRTESAGADLPEEESARRIVDAVMHAIGPDALLEGKEGMIAVSASLLRSGAHFLLENANLRFSVCSSDVADPTVLELWSEAARAGCRLIIDHDSAEELSEAIQQCGRAVRIRAEHLDRSASLIAQVRAGGLDVIVRDVGSHEQFDEAIKAGATHLQGTFFCCPDRVAPRVPAASDIICLRFLAELNRAQLDFAALEEIVKSDVALSCRLLAYLNSAAMGVRHRITSIRQAMVLLGETRLRQWGALAAVSTLGHAKPHELLLTCLVRARLCERLATAGCAEGETIGYFLAGMLSTLDAMMDLPMEHALKPLPIADDVRQALLGDTSGSIGQMLQLVKAVERGAWTTVRTRGRELGIAQSAVAAAYFEALRWTHGVYHDPA